jgi:hypothetical protein
MIEWVVPLKEGMITDIAVHFVWRAVPGAEYYELEYAAAADFTKAVHVTVNQVSSCTVGYFLPSDSKLPKAGTVYARVTADSGEQSEILSFFVNSDHQKSPLRWDMSPDSPYFAILDYSDHDYGRVYEILPETLKPYTAIGNCASYRAPSCQILEYLMQIDAQGYPWHLGAAGPHETSGERYAITPLAVIEYVLQNAVNLKGIGLVEQYMGRRSEDDWRILYFSRLIILCAKYGMAFFYSDGNRNYLELASFIKRPVYMDLLREYSHYITLAFKQNHSNAAYTCIGAILGAWMDNACAHIGVQPENWYWNDSGFRDDPGAYYGYLQGGEQQIPACMTAQMMLTGLSMGAEFYAMEGEGWLIQAKGNYDIEWSPQGIAALNTMQAIIANKLIPDKKTVLADIHAAVSAEGLTDELGDAWEGGKYRLAFQNLYAIEHKHELFMKQSRYFLLPLITDRKKTFHALTTIDAEALKNADEMNAALNPLYAEQNWGNAYITKSGGVYTIMNSNENKNCAQFVHINPLAANGKTMLCTRIEAAFGLWQHALVWQDGNVLHIFINAPQGSELNMRIYTPEKLNTACLGDGAISRDTNVGCYEIKLKGNDVPVELVLSPGKIKPFSYSRIENEPDSAVYLGDLPFETTISCGKWLPVKNFCANKTYGLLPLSINALRFKKGISLVRGTTIVFRLDKPYSRLEMTIGFDIDAWMPIIKDRDNIIWDRYAKTISMRLTVSGGDSVLYISPEMTSTLWKETVTIPLAGIDLLTFKLEGQVISNVPGVEVFLDIGNPVLYNQ